MMTSSDYIIVAYARVEKGKQYGLSARMYKSASRQAQADCLAQLAQDVEELIKADGRPKRQHTLQRIQ